ncbi:hypothetical protein HMPREF0653_01276 [Prevotella disiens JCM 6334 = ATCC 29426]|uniref:Uncharacterized protein n=1 Tax=Prevotella disiens JCM 6334 = ATCC 29426 TaxID=1235811 RepID=A0ABN0NSB2_9BACT|nr:hypothetical protein HMPREF0653_01276 [Prevotella disiens JCM 6334 = ATCC 29426]
MSNYLVVGIPVYLLLVKIFLFRNLVSVKNFCLENIYPQIRN